MNNPAINTYRVCDSCGNCKHSIWFDSWAMRKCEKRPQTPSDGYVLISHICDLWERKDQK